MQGRCGSYKLRTVHIWKSLGVKKASELKKNITDEFILKADEALSILNICIFHTHINIKIGPLSTFLQSNKLGYSNSKSSS